jgi:hypothetical protein
MRKADPWKGATCSTAPVPISVRSRRKAERVALSDRLGRNLNDEPFGPWKWDRFVERLARRDRREKEPIA